MSWTPAQLNRLGEITRRLLKLELEILAASSGMDYEQTEILEREQFDLLNERLTIRRDMGEIDR